MIARFFVDTSAAARMHVPTVAERVAPLIETGVVATNAVLDWTRALDAQRVLSRTGRHRAVGMSDLLTAVLAAQYRLTVVHYDADFEIAADVIDFQHRWVVPPSTA